MRGLSGLNAQPGWGKYEDFAAFVHENCVRRLISLNVTSLTDGRVRVEKLSRLTSTSVEGATVDNETVMLISGDGRISLSVCLRLSGIECVERLGLTWTLPGEFENVEWFGRGPGESYPDRKEAALLGTYRTTVSEMHFPFTPPAENGGREDTKYICLSTDAGEKLTFRFSRPVHFDAHHYNAGDLREAMHEHELTRRRETIVQTDAVHAGIGGDMAWSTVQDEKYAVRPGEYHLEMQIEI